MYRSVLLSSMLLVSVTLAGPSLASDEPSLHQVYEAANAGRLGDALGMMEKVLQGHPNSAKAHFVEAELLAKQGRLAKAEAELTTAERLAPGLPFTKPGAVEKLKQHVSSPRHTPAPLVPEAPSAQPQSASAILWPMLLMGVGLVAAVIFFVRSLRQRRRNMVPSGGGTGYGSSFNSGPGFGPGAPLQPYGAGGVGQPMGPAPGGVGSGILGGLATGAAVGAGMVAGEALMHHFTDGNRHDVNQSAFPAPADDSIAPTDDMGGNDFGVSDTSSWDDSSSGGDWD